MNTLLLLILSYLIGSILSGVWIGKIFYHVDITEHGSGNTGTTNTFRVLGKKAGVIVLLLDILKGTLATCLPLIFGIAVPQLWCGLAAVLGHTFPLYARFKGGKAVATSAGMLLGYSPVFFIYAAALFILSLFCSSMVSLASMITAVLVTLSSIILPFILPSVFPPFNWLLTLIAVFLTLFIFYRHKDNIKRIKAGNENKVPFGLNKPKK